MPAEVPRKGEPRRGSPVVPRRPIAIAQRHPRLRLDRPALRRMLEVLERAHDRVAPGMRALPPGELSLVFLSDDALARLHGAFLDDPSTTDVITFAGHPELGSAGEICVSADTAARYARAHRIDFSLELALYVVHGWLHLLGYDDLAPEKKRRMRRAEARALREVRRAGALPRFHLRQHTRSPAGGSPG
ncbi:MAG: rRNA maturation RNase YbeY [Verrucomicrobia bacterium]|nr:rRNA maturation RNase YbeY [Verrucomicrobiota bacterium]